MIRSALLLMGEQGIDATSFSQVLEHSQAPRGSIYHHFPGGKSQLVEEATRYAGERVARRLDRVLEQSDSPTAGLDALADMTRRLLLDSDFTAGCPVLAATLEGNSAPGARRAAREAFQRWEEVHAEILRRAGVPDARARSLATIAISAIEGAIILARAEHSDAPLERVVDELQNLFASATR